MENIIQVNSDSECNKTGNRGWYGRMKDEQKDLNDKIVKLAKFIDSDAFQKLDFRNQMFLRQQKDAMDDYNTILLKRIYENEPD